MSTEPEKKKILYVITKSNWGGAQKYVHDLATNLPAGRFEPVVAAGGSDLLFEKLAGEGVRAISVPGLDRDVGVMKDAATFFRLLRIFVRERPDVIHLNSSKAGGIGALAAFISKFCKLPTTRYEPQTIYTVHGWPFHEDRPLWQKAGIFLASWFTSLLCGKVVLISTADFRAAQKFIPKKKLVLISNGVETPAFVPRHEARAHFARRLGRPITEDTLLIGTIAEYTRNKGLAYLIEAAHHLRTHAPQFTFRVLLMGEGEEREVLARQIRTLELQNDVFLANRIAPDPSSAHRYLKGLDVFILPSVKEGLPYALMEAMAAGLPIAASNIGGIPDLIAHGREGLLVPPKEPHALADAVCAFFLSQETRARMADAAQKKQKEKFSLDQMLEETMDLYDQTG